MAQRLDRRGGDCFTVEVGKFGLGYYLGRESTASSFGAAGAVVLLLLWVYFASCILLFGAEFTQTYAKETGHAIQPSPGAEAVTEDARAQQGLATSDGPKEPPRSLPLVQAVAIPAEPAGPNPLLQFLAAFSGAFAFGLILRRRAERVAPPTTRIREGLADLGGQATEGLVDLANRARREIARRRR